jgi:hypothetical protein
MALRAPTATRATTTSRFFSFTLDASPAGFGGGRVFLPDVFFPSGVFTPGVL